MSILRHIMEKPWESPRGPEFAMAGESRARRPAAAVGLRVFVCVVTVLFSLLVAAYAERMVYEDWRPTPQQWVLWVNTGLLVLSSVALQWASISVRRGRMEDARAGMLSAGLFAVGFLIGQYGAWRQLSGMVAFDITNPAAAFFYMITALHGLHLLGGLVAWGRTTLMLWRRPDPADAALPVRLCAFYWHFLLVLWLILFTLLFSGRDNLTTLLALCGLR